MHGLYIERRSLNGHGSVSWDLAHHMYARSMCGKIAVVTDKPKELMPAVRKQWFRLIRLALRERSRTLKSARIMELTQQIAHMQKMLFTCKLSDMLEGDVTFATADDFVAMPPMCATVYVIADGVEKEKLYLLTAWMPKSAVVIIYK